MFKKLQKPNSEGFTIIEIVIVLAIAALILLIVFLALPSLQRSQRNTARKSDAGHVSSAINNFVSNNNGKLPGGTAGADWNAGNRDCQTLIGNSATNTGDAGTLSQYNFDNSFICGGVGNGVPNRFEWDTGGTITLHNNMRAQAMVLVTNSQCPASAGASPTVQPATTPRQASLMYTVEQSGGNWLWNCIQTQ